jgi:hypothetical protein
MKDYLEKIKEQTMNIVWLIAYLLT